MPYFFLLPNLVFFGLFVFRADRHQLRLLGHRRACAFRPTDLRRCRPVRLSLRLSGVDPSTCREDHFWRGVFNTLRFSLFQVVAMVGLSLLTAIVLNMRIRGRGFFRAVYFFPSCCPRWSSR